MCTVRCLTRVAHWRQQRTRAGMHTCIHWRCTGTRSGDIRLLLRVRHVAHATGRLGRVGGWARAHHLEAGFVLLEHPGRTLADGHRVRECDRLARGGGHLLGGHEGEHRACESELGEHGGLLDAWADVDNQPITTCSGRVVLLCTKGRSFILHGIAILLRVFMEYHEIDG